jgi:hypothetical protein
MTKLFTAVTLGALIASPVLVQSANAQRLDPARERIIRDCMAQQNRDSHDGYEGKRGGGLQWTYRACVAQERTGPGAASRVAQYCVLPPDNPDAHRFYCEHADIWSGQWGTARA